MAAGGTEGGGVETTPTWIVALVCCAIIFISILLERILHDLGKRWKKQNRRALHGSLLKVKEELMLLGFISLMLALFQGPLSNICISKSATKYMLPCKAVDHSNPGKQMHDQINVGASNLMGNRRRFLAAAATTDVCASKGKTRLLSLSAIHEIHIFIFTLAVTHVVFSATTIILGGLKMHQWKRWEESISSENCAKETGNEFINVRQLSFIKERSLGIEGNLTILSWLSSFSKQFYPGVTKSDYITLRLGFVQKHCQGNPKFNFHKYMVRALEADFKKVVGISWSLWIFVVIFLLLNVNGWDIYFWMAFIPLLLLLTVGTKLEHVITQLARDVIMKHTAIEGDLVVQLLDDHFWFQKPPLVLHIIHFILFQNAFEIAFFFWSLFMFGHDSCIMGNVYLIIPRLIIGIIVQVLCSFSTLPLYAIVTQMGSSFKRAIFDEHIQANLRGWAQKVKKKKEVKSDTIHLGESSSVTMKSIPDHEI